MELLERGPFLARLRDLFERAVRGGGASSSSAARPASRRVRKTLSRVRFPHICSGIEFMNPTGRRPGHLHLGRFEAEVDLTDSETRAQLCGELPSGCASINR
jgi:hypothetical protein